MESEKQNIIYGLFCPFTDEIYYVGKSTCGLSRPLWHLSDSHSDKIREWVEGLDKIGHAPDIRILEVADSEDELRDKEQFWIYKYVREGKRLLNIQMVKAAEVLIKTRQVILSNQTLPSKPKKINYIADFVKLSRKDLKLTQQDIASKAGVGLRFIRELEQGKESIQLDKVKAVLNLFGATLIPYKSTPL